MSKIFAILALRPANLAQIEVYLCDGGGEERQPPPRKIVLPNKRESLRSDLAAPTSQTLAVWTGQEPGERIANTILLCAIRDRARQVTLEPSARGVKVCFQIESGVREQKLPAFALAPIVRHFKALASEDTTHQSATDELAVENDEIEFSLPSEVRVAVIAVDEQFYEVRFSPLPTQWGDGIKVQLSPQI